MASVHTITRAGSYRLSPWSAYCLKLTFSRWLFLNLIDLLMLDWYTLWHAIESKMPPKRKP